MAKFAVTKTVVSAEIAIAVNSFFVPPSRLGGIIEMKIKSFIISEIVALALIGFGYFMASSDFLGCYWVITCLNVLWGQLVPRS